MTTAPPISISSYFVRATLANTSLSEKELAQLLARCRIPRSILYEDNFIVSAEQYARLQVHTILLIQDEALGYSGCTFPIGSWRVMCLACINAETLGEAFEIYCDFYNLFNGGFHTALIRGKDVSSIQLINTDNKDFRPFTYESYLFNTHRFSSWLTQEHLPLISVCLPYQRPSHFAEYRRLFLNNPVVFGHEFTGLLFHSHLLEMPIKQNIQSLRNFLNHSIYRLLTQTYDTESWSAKIQQIIRKNISETPSFEVLAMSMHVHPQTLRRRLNREGTSYRDIKNNLRRDTAIYHLGKQSLSIEKIAERSGFSEASSFIRAFKCWTGVTPSVYRSNL